MSIKQVIVVDFDETLVFQNTLLLLHQYLTKQSALWSIFGAIQHINQCIPAIEGEPELDKYRGVHERLKAEMYDAALSGRSEKDIIMAADALHTKISVNSSVWMMIQSILDGNTFFIIATASLEVFVRRYLEHVAISPNKIIGSVPELQNNIFNGKLVGRECAGLIKGLRVRNYLASHFPNVHISAFGNLPADRQMMALADEAWVIRRGLIKPFNNLSR